MSPLPSPEPEPANQSTTAPSDPSPAPIGTTQPSTEDPPISPAPAPLPPTATPPPAPHPREIAAEEGGVGPIPVAEMAPALTDETNALSAATIDAPLVDVEPPTASSDSTTTIPSQSSAHPPTILTSPSESTPQISLSVSPPPAPSAPAARRRSSVPDPLALLESHVNQLISAARKNDLKTMSSICQQAIIWNMNEQIPSDMDVLYLASLLLLKLINDRIPSAINLLQNTNSTHRTNALISDLAILISAVSNYRYSAAWAALDRLESAIRAALVQQAHPLTHKMHEVLEYLHQRFDDVYSDKVIRTISTLYATIPLAELTSYIGRTSEETLKLIEQRNWSIDEASSLVTPLKPVEKQNNATTIRQFEQLARSIASLEQH